MAISPAPNRPECYEALRGDFFAVSTAPGLSTSLQLTEVKRTIDNSVQLSFSLLFQGPEALPQGSHHVRHPSLGEFELFLVPLRPANGQYIHQAVFNLLRPRAPLA